MRRTPTSADEYLSIGCGRCSKGATPDCKVHKWSEELHLLRSIILECGLKEEIKWGVPCYTTNGKNVLNLSALVNCCVVGFFKGALLANEHHLLEAPGPNSRFVRQLRFTSTAQIDRQRGMLKSIIAEAIEIEKQGKEVKPKPTQEPIPRELLSVMENDAAFKAAFNALSPGRQRGYLLYFSQPKKSATRLSRIEKCKNNILNGIGLHDRNKP
ncbi:MAG: YdeI family protein [Salibacteraceae bacterium]